jgi:flagellin
MANDFALGASMRTNLLSLQKTNSLLDMTQERLSTGRKINSALDGAQAFFTAQSLNNRSSDLGKLLDGMGQSIQTIKAADKGVTAISKLIDQADAIATQAKDTLAGDAAADVSALAADYDEVFSQIDALVGDASYRGINLLGGDDLVTKFNEDGSSELTTTGADFTASGLSISAADFTDTSTVDAAIAEIDAAREVVRGFGSSISNSLSIIQTREDFTKETMNVLEEGADKLTLADLNEEGANMLALQTRLQLGVSALSLASQSQQSVLSLLR